MKTGLWISKWLCGLAVIVAVACGGSSPTSPPFVGDGGGGGDQGGGGSPDCPGPYPDWRTSEYVLPYEVGTSHVVVNGNCPPGMTNAHQGINKYAYDFLMDIGTTITAARDGTVVRVVQGGFDFNGNGHVANRVTLEHADGTASTYVHLTQGGSLVREGDFVHSGDPIALSGSSGLSVLANPHLHFSVLESSQRGAASVPATFRNTAPNPLGLVQGTSYEALPDRGIRSSMPQSLAPSPIGPGNAPAPRGGVPMHAPRDRPFDPRPE